MPSAWDWEKAAGMLRLEIEVITPFESAFFVEVLARHGTRYVASGHIPAALDPRTALLFGVAYTF